MVRNDADGSSVETGKTDDQVRGKLLVDFQEPAVVDNLGDDLLHVVRFVRTVGDDPVEKRRCAPGGIGGVDRRRIVHVVGGEIAEERLDGLQALGLSLAGEMSDAASRGVRSCAAELFGGDLLVGHRFHDAGSRHEHAAGLSDHQGEVGDGRRIDGTSRTRTEDGGDLRDDA